jgi:hypothetical protein
LNDILGFTGLAAIQDVEFLATILDPEIASKKQSIVDVLCKDSQGSRYIIEIQFTKTKGFEKRVQYYAATPTQVKQIKVIIITILRKLSSLLLLIVLFFQIRLNTNQIILFAMRIPINIT